MVGAEAGFAACDASAGSGGGLVVAGPSLEEPCMILSMSVILERRTVTMPAETARAVSERVGARQFSAYVAQATAEKLRLDAIRETLAQMQAEHGPVDQEDLDAVLAAFRP